MKAIHTHTHVHTYMHRNTHTLVYTHIYTHAKANAHMHAHKHIHMFTLPYKYTLLVNLLFFSLLNMADKGAFLSNAKNLHVFSRDDEKKNVFINADLTSRERQRRYVLRDKRKLHIAAGEKDFAILPDETFVSPNHGIQLTQAISLHYLPHHVYKRIGFTLNFIVF